MIFWNSLDTPQSFSVSRLLGGLEWLVSRTVTQATEGRGLCECEVLCVWCEVLLCVVCVCVGVCVRVVSNVYSLCTYVMCMWFIIDQFSSSVR